MANDQKKPEDKELEEESSSIKEQEPEPLRTAAPWGILIFAGVIALIMIVLIIVICHL